MYPAYGGMNSFPYQTTQMPSTQYYYPSWEAAPPQVKADPATAGPSSMYGSWPQNYSYPAPAQSPNCCNHALYPPAYYNFRPPYPHFASPPLAYGHNCGGYPSYPVNYVPPPHYATELPRYEYDKNAPREFHCCGCHHHPCHVKEDKHVKIEEHGPEVETKKIESLVPAGANNYTQPILWIPPGYTTNKERQQQLLPRRVVENEPDRQQISPYFVKKPQWQQKPTESEGGVHVESPLVRKPQQSVKTIEQEPNVRYGWFPLDMNSFKELLEGGQGKKARERESKGADGKHIQDGENKELNKQFPLPIFWMPYGGQEENDVKGQQAKDVGETPGKETSPTFKIIPMRFEHPENEPEKIKTAVGDDDSGVGGRAPVKTIPVKQSEESVPKQLKEEEQKDEGKPVKNTEGNGNGHSSSPKKSKLPPICLRVDPPKKKNGNGSSRSPSPTADKKREESEEPKTGGRKKEIKVTEAVDKGSSRSKIEVSCKAGEAKKEKTEGDIEKKGVEGQQSQEAKESKPQEAKKPAEKVLSEQEAATIIQSSYRGYDVRRWEPLKKLRQIAQIREEAAKVKKHIEDLDSCTGSSVGEKEKATVAETIMKLLLKLDTIQGLPPSFRDVRRSVAKDLITLQEKLDWIINKKSTPVAQEPSTAEEPSKVSGKDEGSKGDVETVEELSKVSSRLEGSEVIETVKEQSSVSGLDESSRNIGKTAKESSKVSSQVENLAGEEKGAKTCTEDEDVLKLNEVSSAPLLTSQDVVGGFEEETSETSPVGMETQSEPHDEIASSPPVPTVADSLIDVKKEESDASEIVQGKPPAGSLDQHASIGTIENTTEQVGVASGHNDEQINVHAELTEKVIEDKHEISDVELNSGTALREECIECAHNSPASKAPDVDLAPVEKDEESTRQAELPQEVTEEGVRERTSDEPTAETLTRDEEKDQSADVKDEATMVTEPESCNPESTDSTSLEAQKVQEADPVHIGILILEQSVHGPEESAAEKLASVEAGSEVGDVPRASTEEVDEAKHSLTVDGECDATMTSRENEVSRNEDAHEFVGGEQERTLEEKVRELDQQTLCDFENLKHQSVRSANEAPQIVTQESKHEENAPKESKEGQEEEQLDKRIMEENEKLRGMLERLIASAKEQQDLISTLSGKVKDLEKRLARKKKMKSTKRRRVLVSRA